MYGYELSVIFANNSNADIFVRLKIEREKEKIMLIFRRKSLLKCKLTLGKSIVYKLVRQGKMIRGKVTAIDKTNAILITSVKSEGANMLIISPVISVLQKAMYPKNPT